MEHPTSSQSQYTSQGDGISQRRQRSMSYDDHDHDHDDEEEDRRREEEPSASGALGEEGGKKVIKLTKPQAKALKGKYIEIFWDGEAEWFEAEVRELALHACGLCPDSRRSPSDLTYLAGARVR